MIVQAETGASRRKAMDDFKGFYVREKLSGFYFGGTLLLLLLQHLPIYTSELFPFDVCNNSLNCFL